MAGPLGRLWRKGRPYFKAGLCAALGAGALVGGWRLEQARDARLMRVRGEADWAFATEAADLAQELRMERMLPVHDLRPAYSRVRARMDRLRERLGLTGEPAGGPGHLALATIQALLGDAPEALAELAKAKADGLGPAGTAQVLGYTLAAHSLAEPGWPDPAALELLEGEARTAPAPEPGADRFPEALLAFLRRDYPRAAAEAFVMLQAQPWNGGAEALEGLSLVAQARKLFDEGDLAGAEDRYQEALAGTAAFLARVPSEERVHHVHLLAARGLCLLDLSRGTLGPETLERFLERGDQALWLDPGSGELQGDWIDLRLLKVRQLEELGKAAEAPLAAVRAFADIRLKPPLTGSLRNLRLAILLQGAAQALDHGRDPGHGLAQAVGAPLPVPALEEDHLARALALQARVELAGGRIPGPPWRRPWPGSCPGPGTGPPGPAAKRRERPGWSRRNGKPPTAWTRLAASRAPGPRWPPPSGKIPGRVRPWRWRG